MTSSAPRQDRKASCVYLNYDQGALDAAYDQAAYATNGPQLIKRYASNSDVTRLRIGAPTRVSYGATPIESLEIYRTSRPNAPVFVFNR